MNSKLSIQQAAQILGVSAKTLRRWEASGVLIPARSAGGQRRYILDEIKNFKKPKKALDSPIVVPEIPFAQGVLASPILPSQKTIIAWAIGTLILAGMAVGGTKLYSFSKLFKAGPGTLAQQAEIGAAEIGSGAVLAAESVNPEYNLKVGVPTIFTKDITAPNIIYSLTAGTGISITEGQKPTISTTDQTAGLNIFGTFKVGSTTLSASGKNDSFTFAAGDNISLALDTANKKITITGDDVDIPDVVDSGWTDGGSNVSLTTASDTVTIGSSLIISDGGLIDLSAVVHDDSAAQGLKLPQNTTLTNISTGEGFLAYDSDDNLVKIYDGSAWTTVGGTATGDITAVIAGAGLTGGAASGDATLDIGGSTTITIAADAISVTADSIGDTELAFNTGQNLTTASSPTFADLTLSGDLAVNGDDISSDGNLLIAATGYVRIGDSGTPGKASGDDDLYVLSDIELDGQLYVDGVGAGTVTNAICIDSTNMLITCTAGGTGTGDITAVGSMLSGDVFADATADDDWLGLGASAGRIEFDDQATDEVNILNANVGIGTATPSRQVTVYKSDGTTPVLAVVTGATTGYAQLSLGNTASADASQIFVNATAESALAGASSMNIYNSQNAPIAFYTNATEQMRILAGGNVGIGDTSPAYLLTVGSGDLFGVDGAANTSLFWEGSGADAFETSLTVVNPTADLIYRLADAAAGTYDLCSTVGNCLTGGGAATLQTAYNAGNTITTTTARDIEITLADVATDTTFELTQAGAADALRINDDGTFTDTTPFVVDQSGNVGIGVAVPTNKFTIVAPGAGGNQMRILSTDTEASISLRTNALAQDFQVGVNGSANGFYIYDSTYRFVVNTGGNVGIGDTSPDAFLEVLGTTEQLRLTFTDGTVDSRFTVDSAGDLTINNTGTQTIIADDLQIQGGDLTTNQTTFNLINATATTLNLGGAATTLNIAPTGNGASSLVLSGGSADTGCTINGATGDLTCSGNIAGASTGTNGFWQRNAGVLAPTNITDDIATGATATASATFIASGTTGNVTMTGDAAVNGGDITTTQTTATLFNTTATTLSLGGAATTALNIGNGSGAYTAINLGSGSGTHTINIAGTGATSADTINIGTGGTAADTINLGSSASTTALNLTSGTGAQTFASSVVSGTTTTSAFVFTANSLTTGTGQYLNSSSLSTGILFSDYSTSTALTTGKLGYFNWEPSAAATASGDLVGINIGNGGFTTGNLFNITNVGSSLFAVNQTQIVSTIPHAFNAAGDVSIAYDIQFTNQTASFLKSNAPLYIQAGETFENNNLNLQTFGTGGVVLAAANGTTTTSGTSYALQVTPNLTSATDSLAHTLYGTYNFPVINTTGTGVGVTTLYGNYTGLNKVAGTVTTWFGNYIAAPTGSGTVTTPYALVTEASAGNVGIGLTAPIAKLHVTDSSTATASAFIGNTSTSAGIAGLAIKLSSTTLDTTSRFINFLDKNGINIGKINAANTTSVAYSTNGTDMAEYFVKNDGSSFEPGNVVSASENYAIKTTQPYDSKMLGIVSTAPGFAGGQEGPNKVLIALVGQVPVKIDPASEPITRGDFITSSTDGLAKKATRAGFMLGKALDNWTPGGSDKISVYVSNIWADPGNQLAFDDSGNLSIPGTLTAQDAQIANLTDSVNDRLTTINTQFSNLDHQIASLSAQLADLQIQSDPAASLSAQLWTYATDSGKLVTTLPVQTSDLTVIGKLTVGLLTFDDLEASISSLTGTVTVTGDLAISGAMRVLGDSIGEATVSAGTTEIEIVSSAATIESKFFATPEIYAVPVATEATEAGHFTLRLPFTISDDLKVNWWIVN